MWGYCNKCDAWGTVPDSFDERRHVLRCMECGTQCYLHRNGSASEAGVTRQVELDYVVLDRE